MNAPEVVANGKRGATGKCVHEWGTGAGPGWQPEEAIYDGNARRIGAEKTFFCLKCGAEATVGRLFPKVTP